MVHYTRNNLENLHHVKGKMFLHRFAIMPYVGETMVECCIEVFIILYSMSIFNLKKKNINIDFRSVLKIPAL